MENNGIFDPVNHKLTLGELDNNKFKTFLDELTDVPSSIPLRPYKIDRAGITNQNVYIKINSLFSKKHVEVYCEVTMQVELVGHRGIHMSRCEEALFALLEKQHESLDSFAIALAQELQKIQKSDVAYVDIKGYYLADKKTVKTSRNTKDKIILTANVCVSKKNVYTKIGVSAFNMTGCPCTETYTKFSVAPKLKKEGFSLDQIKTILNLTNSGTHTQRGIATISIDKNSDIITHRSLYEILDKSCHLVFELLKRPDEHELVLRALKKPQFTEDVVREIADSALDVFSRMKSETRIHISSILFDSIHIHDVCTNIDSTLGELKSQK
jgi:MptA/FolE2 family GTP cyclohydrolase